MTTLLESKARPFGSSKGVMVSMVLHTLLIGAAVFGTARVVLPPREKVEEHPVLYVAAPPPPPVVAPEPIAVKAPPRAPAAAPKRAPQPRPVPQPKVPAIPALVAPTKVAISLPSIDLKAVPTITDVVAPSVTDEIKGGVSSAGSVKRGADDGIGSSGGLGSGSAGRAFSENQVDRIVQVTRESAPRYPDALRSVGVSGVVTMRFVVSAEGRVEPGSIEVMSTPHKLFSAAVRTALLETRYRPAEAGGRAVRQLVEQTFSFTLK